MRFLVQAMLPGGFPFHQFKRKGQYERVLSTRLLPLNISTGL